MIHVGDNRDILPTIPDASIDAIVTDPPYELGFMGKTWDSTGIAYNVEMWRECLRVLKPGGHLLAFGGSRTYHRLACAIEDAGFEIRDQIMWVYGSGFPKSLNVGKSIEGLLTTGSANKTAFKNLSGEKIARGDWGIAKQQFTHGQRDTNYDETAGGQRLGKLEPTTAEAKQWEGWGTALKPAHEPIVLARKPLEGTVAANVLEHGTGAINIDACRVEFVSNEDRNESTSKNQHENFGTEPMTNNTVYGDYSMVKPTNYNPPGRWPANLIHDGSDEVLELFPDTKGGTAVRRNVGRSQKGMFAFGNLGTESDYGFGDSGSVARFFYCAKANSRDRNEGLDDFTDRRQDEEDYERAGTTNPRNRSQKLRKNHHPTVKPTDLMRYLCRLITPPGGLILDPFTGSGSTGKAAILEGFRFIGIEQNPEYAHIAETRIHSATQQQ